MGMEKVVKGLEHCLSRYVDGLCDDCPYMGELDKSYMIPMKCKEIIMRDALALLKEQNKDIKALRLLVEWAEECDFGFDQFRDEYERYKDEIKDMKYIDGMVHVAKRTLEDHGAFEG